MLGVWDRFLCGRPYLRPPGPRSVVHIVGLSPFPLRGHLDLIFVRGDVACGAGILPHAALPNLAEYEGGNPRRSGLAGSEVWASLGLSGSLVWFCAPPGRADSGEPPRTTGRWAPLVCLLRAVLHLSGRPRRPFHFRHFPRQIHTRLDDASRSLSLRALLHTGAQIGFVSKVIRLCCDRWPLRPLLHRIIATNMWRGQIGSRSKYAAGNFKLFVAD